MKNRNLKKIVDLKVYCNPVPSAFLLLKKKKQIDVSFSFVCHVIDNEIRHNNYLELTRFQYI